MASMNQDRKKELTPAIKAVLKKYGIKGSIAVQHGTTLIVNIKEGSIDFVGNHNAIIEEGNKHAKIVGRTQGHLVTDGYIQVNEYHLDRGYTGKALSFLKELKDAMNKGNFNKSDSMTDYFHVGWYTDINIGQWDKGYKFITS
jgi:hypothetical protein